MSRLPAIAGDNSTWGTVLNDFLSVSLAANGTLKNAPARLAGTSAVPAPIQYYHVGDFGAVADGVPMISTFTVNGTALSRTDGGTWTAADVGKAVCVQAAGAGGNPLITTIATFVSASSVTVTLAASSPQTNVSGVYGTDNTTFFNNAAIAMGATTGTAGGAPGQGGELRFGAGLYLTTNTVTLMAPSTNGSGVRVVGAGGGGYWNTSRQGTIIMLLSRATFTSALAVQNNLVSCVIEGISLWGLGVFQTNAVPAYTAGTASAQNGPTLVGLFMYFASAVIRDFTAYGFNTGVWTLGCQRVLFESGDIQFCRNYGVVTVSGSCVTIGPAFMVHNINQGGAAGASETVANIVFDGYNTANPSIACRVEGGTLDECEDGASGTVTAVKNVYLGATQDTYIGPGVLYPIATSAGARANRYGIHVSANSVRTLIKGLAIIPYTVTADRLCTNTIKIDAGAVNTNLQDIVTVPNAGGDISDAGTGSTWTNVRLNNGPPITTIPTKAGVPVDGDYNVAPPVGAQVLDTTDGKLYYRTASATWKAATLT